MIDTYVLVGCGKVKQNNPAPASELYTSGYFAKKREWAELNGKRWWVLSAKHGAIPPWKVIEPYDMDAGSLEGRELEQYRRRVRLHLRACDAKWINGELVVLAGKDYIEPLGQFFQELPCEVRFPFSDTSGIGEQRAWLSEEIAASKSGFNQFEKGG